jgi:hypothetical protein
MAKDDNEHRMLFDLRGRRRNVIKVVYAVLAILMGASLFLTVGPFSIAELFGDDGTNGNAAEVYEEQAERIEAKLEKDPKDPALLTSLTRAKINAGNSGFTEENGEQGFTPEAVQHYQEAYQAWSEYLEATDEPSAGLALVVAPMLLQLAELSRTYPEASSRIKAATETQKVVAEQRPSVNAFTTLAFYTYFTGDTEAAEKARAEAKKLASSKSERETIDTQLDELKKNADRFLKEKAQAEKQEKAAGGAAPEGLESPLGGGLGGTGLGE